MRAGFAALPAADQPDAQNAALLAELALRQTQDTGGPSPAGLPAAATALVSAARSAPDPEPSALRAGHLDMAAWICGQAPAVAELDHPGVPAGPAGEPAIQLRRYQPRLGATRAIVHVHGGGWVVGSLDSYDTFCRQLALACDAQVFSIAYRLAPEHPFPAAVIDCERALRHVMDGSDAFGLDADRIVLAGDSAGGHLALTAARWLKRAGRPLPAGLVLFYPNADRRLVSASARQFAQGHYLTADLMRWYWDAFAGRSGLPDTHPDLSPLLADDLAGLPRTFVLTAGCDLLRDEGEQLAVRLQMAGVPAEFERMPGSIHGFMRFGGRLDSAARGFRAVAEVLARWRL